MIDVDPRVPPHDLEAELAVIGGVLIDASVTGTLCAISRRVMTMLRPEDFYRSDNARLWGAMQAAHDRGDPLDVGALRGVDGIDEAYRTRIATFMPTPTQGEYHARRVLQASRLRSIILAASEASRLAYDGDETAIDAFHHACAEYVAASEGVDGKLSALLPGALEALCTPVDLRSGERGHLPWRIDRIDHQGSWIHPGDYVVVAGRPGTGKSTWAIGWAYQTALATGKAVIYVSMEMTPEEVTRKLLCHVAGVADPGLERPTPQVRAALEEASTFLLTQDVRVFIPPRFPRKVEEFCRWARGAIYRENPAAIVVDYLGLLAGDGRNLNEKLTHVSGTVRALALDTGVPVIALHQMNREVEKDTRLPRLSDLRDSGSVEQDATHAAFFFVASKSFPKLLLDSGDLALMLIKSRHGRGHVTVPMVADYAASRIFPRVRGQEAAAYVPGGG